MGQWTRRLRKHCATRQAGRQPSRILTAAMRIVAAAGLIFFAATPAAVNAQDRLKTMPGYERYQRMSRESTNAVKLGSLAVTWKDQGKAFEYQKDGKRFRYEIAARKA